MSSYGEISFMDANSSQMEQMIYFHDHTSVILMLITLMVGYLLYSAVANFYNNRVLTEGQELETFWTIVPGVILIFIAFPSLQLLYLMEESKVSPFSVKVSGSQWYWTYSYHDFLNLSFKSQYVENFNYNSFLGVDNRTILPVGVLLQLVVSASDVIHSWTVPSLGVKTDAVPGRSNYLMCEGIRVGLYFGQCSEICGAQHSFMPIVLELIPLNKFLFWLESQIV